MEDIRLDEDKLIAIAMQHLEDKDIKKKVPAIRILGNICVDSEASVNKIINKGTLDILVSQLLAEENNSMLLELSWVLSNIASGPTLHIAHLLDSGAMNRLIDIGLTCDSLKVLREITLDSKGSNIRYS
jgi:hypothetical protein